MISFLQQLWSAIFGPKATYDWDSEEMAAVKQLVQRAIQANKVVVFSKSWCPYCNRSKEIFRLEREQFQAIELNQLENGSAVQAYLEHISGQRTVPNIYIRGNHIGGCSDLEELQSNGQLHKLLTNDTAQPK